MVLDLNLKQRGLLVSDLYQFVATVQMITKRTERIDLKQELVTLSSAVNDQAGKLARFLKVKGCDSGACEAVNPETSLHDWATQKAVLFKKRGDVLTKNDNPLAGAILIDVAKIITSAQQNTQQQTAPQQNAQQTAPQTAQAESIDMQRLLTLAGMPDRRPLSEGKRPNLLREFALDGR